MDSQMFFSRNEQLRNPALRALASSLQEQVDVLTRLSEWRLSIPPPWSMTGSIGSIGCTQFVFLPVVDVQPHTTHRSRSCIVEYKLHLHLVQRRHEVIEVGAGLNEFIARHVQGIA